MIALIAFPVALLIFAAGAAVFFALPLLLFVPFLLLIAIFLGTHLSWTVAARLASTWAGLEAFTRQTSFMSGFWNALPLALVLHITAAALEWAVGLALFQWRQTADPETFAKVGTLLDEVVSPAAWGLYIVLMAMVLAPRVIGLEVRHAGAYGTAALLGRCVIVLPLAGAVTWLASLPLEQFVHYAVQLWEDQRSLSDPEFSILDFLKVPVFYAGVLIWLSSSILLSFEAQFLARLEATSLADRFAREAARESGETKADYRALRKRWSERD